jgi:putative transposase
LYYQPCDESQGNMDIMRLLDEQYFKTPFFGVRKLTVWLKGLGYVINRKRVKRLMGLIGWQTIYRRPNTSKPNKKNRIYPYLLKGLEINRPNHVCAMDITHVPMRRGFMYLCAIIDLHTRFVLNWSVSNTMTADWCTEVVDEAIKKYGKPEIMNTDQGGQFTSHEFTGLLSANEISISMDGKGRTIDNIFVERSWRSVKYEHIYLHSAQDGVELYEGLKNYFEFYNAKRPHQSLDYQAPVAMYLKAA